MDCDVAKEQIGAWVDRQLSSEEAVALEAHLSVCDECRAASEWVRMLDANLLRAFLPGRESARKVTSEVLIELSDESGFKPIPLPIAKARWWPWLLTTAAGFLLATLLFQPWRNGKAHVESPVAKHVDKQAAVAELVSATGEVQIRNVDAPSWSTLPNSYTCPTGSAVRTGPYVQCELRTTDGCVIRLNKRTEITLTSADQIELQQGQIWCSAPQDVSLKVVASEGKPALKTVPNSPMSALCCPSSSCAVAEMQKDGFLQVTTAEGVTELQTSSGKEQIGRGESASIINDRIVKSASRADLILATAWIHPLLVQKGRDNQELSNRVDELLAKIGQSKLDTLYEQEIRSLDEYAALPLLRYVQSPLSSESPHRRLEAIRILSDVAPPSMIAELIGLLSDNDPETRFYTAKALERLTGLQQDRQPVQWRESLKECQPTIDRWKSWWMERERRDAVPREKRTAKL